MVIASESWLVDALAPRTSTALWQESYEEPQADYVVLQEAGTSLGPYRCLRPFLQSYALVPQLIHLQSLLMNASPLELLPILQSLRDREELERLAHNGAQAESFAKKLTGKLRRELESYMFQGEESLILTLMDLSEAVKHRGPLAMRLSPPRENARYSLAEASFYAFRGQPQEEKRLLRLFEAAREVFALWRNSNATMERAKTLELRITTKLLLLGYDVRCSLSPEEKL